MVVALGLGFPGIRLLHLLRHAGFKALLFICFGYFLLAKKHNQDLRLLGTSFKGNFIVNWVFFLCVLSNSGLLFLSGFYSKDLVLLRVSGFFKGVGVFCLFLVVLFTGGYRSRLAFLSLSNSLLKTSGLQAKISPPLLLSLFPLVILSVGGGWFFKKVLSLWLPRGGEIRLLLLLCLFMGYCLPSRLLFRRALKTLFYSSYFRGWFFVKRLPLNLFGQVERTLSKFFRVLLSLLKKRGGLGVSKAFKNLSSLKIFLVLSIFLLVGGGVWVCL